MDNKVGTYKSAIKECECGAAISYSGPVHLGGTYICHQCGKRYSLKYDGDRLKFEPVKRRAVLELPEMPESCKECKLRYFEYIYYCNITEEICSDTGRRPDCPLKLVDSDPIPDFPAQLATEEVKAGWTRIIKKWVRFTEEHKEDTAKHLEHFVTDDAKVCLTRSAEIDSLMDESTISKIKEIGKEIVKAELAKAELEFKKKILGDTTLEHFVTELGGQVRDCSSCGNNAECYQSVKCTSGEMWMPKLCITCKFEDGYYCTNEKGSEICGDNRTLWKPKPVEPET